MPILRTVRAMVPKAYRAALIRNRATSALIRSFVRKDQCVRHPHCDCTFAFDGQRALGWATGGLADWEREYFIACTRVFRTMKPSVVWDVGANVGIWSLFFARAFDSVETVVAYEPDAINLRMLHRNVEINALADCIQVRPAALSVAVGTAEFQVDDLTGSTGSLEREEGFITRYYGRPTRGATVATTTIDQELASGLPPPQFLKIDVEGHEADVFLGAKNMLTTVRPVMIIEFTGPRASVAVRVLKEHNYVLLCPRSGRERVGVEYELIATPAERTSEIAASLVQ